MMRPRQHVDQFVRAVIIERLGRPDLVDTIPSSDELRIQSIKAEIGIHEARIKRAQSDYDDELIEGHGLKRIRNGEATKIAALEKERRSLTIATDLGGVLDTRSPLKAFNDVDLMIKSRVIDFIMTVKLHQYHCRNLQFYNFGDHPRMVPGAYAGSRT